MYSHSQELMDVYVGADKPKLTLFGTTDIYFGFAVEVVDVGELAVGYCVVGRIGVSYCLIVPLNFIESIFGGWDMGLKRGGEERRGKSRQ